MVYKGQTLLTIELDTGYDLTSATDPKIHYRKPDGSTVGNWVATKSGTKISYALQTGNIDQAGEWSFHATFIDGGKKGYSDKITILFHQPNE